MPNCRLRLGISYSSCKLPSIELSHKIKQMAAAKGPTKKGQPSIKYRRDSVEGESFKIFDFVLEEKKQSSQRDNPKSNQIVSTAALIVAVDQIWDDVFRPKEKLNSCLKEEILDDLDRVVYCKALGSADRKKIYSDPKAAAQLPPTFGSKLEFPNVNEKMGFFDHNNPNQNQSLFQMFLQSDASSAHESWKERGFGIEKSFGMEKMYSWMKDMVPAGVRYCMSGIEIKKANIYARNLAVADTECCSTIIDSRNSQLSNCSELRMDTGSTSLSKDYLLTLEQDIQAGDDCLCIPYSKLCSDYLIDISRNKAHEEWKHLTDSKEILEKEIEGSQTEICSSLSNEVPKYALAKQEHAFAGALAGINVSLCLHPVDTVKTIIQSCRVESKSLYYIGKTIVSERGFAGLYRGLASNLASSAPVSALYTFTYESAKKALLPLFPKEYYSLAHCVAGGCASVATSFIFTPSECIKQQMQVGSRYNNCWNAFVEIIRKGGFRSLYTGWGAVLCRNVPHSIIKFYAYERLKQVMFSPLEPGAQPSTLQTLLCGGIAGSTAALFTTPFDVIKTRLQTQIPGSVNQYDNVFQAIQEISKQEGLRGLYRGLIPRLVMYMSQGALFFASYEFFKSSFCSEVPQPNSSRIWHKPNEEDDSDSHLSMWPSVSSL